jgi:hypothetical protein
MYQKEVVMRNKWIVYLYQPKMSVTTLPTTILRRAIALLSQRRTVVQLQTIAHSLIAAVKTYTLNRSYNIFSNVLLKK